MSQPTPSASGAAPNRISVALCTYNGEQFLPKQLDSLQKQTRLPDELIICDDASTDRTFDILNQFAGIARFPVKLFRNATNLGSSKNFEQAIRLCEGDLIALSDQDDIWYENRLEQCARALISDSAAGLVFSDADIIDEQDRLTGERLWHRLGFLEKPRHDLLAGKFVVLAKQRFVTGATAMFRAALRDRFLPIGDGWVHDEWIALISAAFCDLKPIDQPLIQYRIHGSQQVGFQNKFQHRLRSKPRAERHWARLAESARELQQVCDILTVTASGGRPAVLPAYLEHLRFISFRYSLPPNRVRRLGPVLGKYSEYGVHALGVASMLKDLTLARSESS
jgi:glycosyltransferase involved in cell wall biosynthesis